MSIRERLAELDVLLADGTITKTEHEEARKAALGIGGATRGNGEDGPTSATIVGQVVQSAGGFTPGMTELSCRKGHKIAYLQHTSMIIMDGRGRATHNSVVCSSCMVRLQVGDFYFNCTPCGTQFCRDCITNRRYLNYSPEWSTGLFACHRDCASCFDAHAFLWCFQAMMCSRVTRGFETPPSEEDIVETGCTGSTLGLGCGLFWYDLFSLFIMNFYSFIPRKRIIQSFGIDEGCCSTCLKSYFCRPCSDLQVHREMTIRGMYPGGICCSRRPSAKLLASVRAPSAPLMMGRSNDITYHSGQPRGLYA